MAFIKSFLAGLLGLVVYVVCVTLWTFRELFSPSTGLLSSNTGSGGIGFVSVGVTELIVPGGLIAFALAFWWQWRRTHRRKPARPIS